MLIKRELKIWTLYKIFLSIITVKTPFLSSLLISLRCESVNGVSYIRTDISVYGDCFIDMPAELTDMPAEII